MNTARLDISSPDLADAIAKVRSDTTPENFCLFGYEGKSKIVLKELGTSSFTGLVDALEEGDVAYGLLRVEGGRDQESKAVKFVYVVWVGPSVGGMAKGRVGSHKMDLKEVIGWTVVDIQTDDKDDLTEAVIREKLKKASGANYDLGSNAGGSYQSKAGDIGKSAAAKYKELEKDSNIGPVQFEKFARPKETPMDLGGRPMVAPPTAAKANTVVRDEEAIGKSKVGSEPTAEQKAAEAARLAAAATPAAPPPPPEPEPPAAPPPPEPEPPAPPEPELPAPPPEAPSEDADAEAEAGSLTARVMEAALKDE